MDESRNVMKSMMKHMSKHILTKSTLSPDSDKVTSCDVVSVGMPSCQPVEPALTPQVVDCVTIGFINIAGVAALARESKPYEVCLYRNYFETSPLTLL